MIKNALIVISFILGIKFGVEYLFSPKFQVYGDTTKAPWTCQVNNTIGHLMMVVSHYEEAMAFFEKSIKRCPDTPMCEVGEFEVAECLTKLNRYREATVAYKLYTEKYPGTQRAKIAERAAQIIQ